MNRLLVGALLLTFILLPSLRAQEARFFRIAGPVPTTITALTAGGTVTWTNAPINATFTVQVAQSRPGPSNWVDYLQVPATGPGTTHRLYDPNPPSGMALIPAGNFTMGNCMDPNEGASDELPLHTVYVAAFYMDRHEVTKALWDEVYQWARPPSPPPAGLAGLAGLPGLPYSFDYGAGGKSNTHPAQRMTWYDAVKWCNARSEKEGLTPAYYTSAAQTTVYRSGKLDVQNDWVKWNAGYRLPTEAEWEKAARGGASGHRFPWSDTDGVTHGRANYYVYRVDGTNYFAYDTSPTGDYHPTFGTGGQPYTSPAGYFSANGYGLHDMAGNVWEWCWDWYDSSYYSLSPGTDPRGPASGSARVSRSGSWYSLAWHCRAALRRGDTTPSFRCHQVGFRTVRPL